MLQFFRKVRHRLLTENRFTKYLLYAIGEIVLVVIGILIALQVNTNQEAKKNIKIEIDYLKGIVVELDQDIYDLNELADRDLRQMDAYTMVLKAFDDVTLRQSKTFVSSVGVANTFYAFAGNDIVFDDMKSSGRINNIKSDKLRLGILKYYKKAKMVSKNQRESSVPQLRGLSEAAFLTNLDMNSFIEGFMFDSTEGVELDRLDLSFFDKSLQSDEVKSFANRVSMMKAIVKVNGRKNEQLLYGAEELKQTILTYLDSKGVTIENKVPDKTLEAIKNGDVGQLEKLIDKSTLNDCFFMEDESGNYLVHCITFKSLPSLKFFVEKGADLELVCERKTPLMYAVKYGELEMVKYLVESGADLTASNRGRTPLQYARVYERPEIEKYLLEQNAK